MGDTFDKVNERKNQAELQEKIKILADYVWIVSGQDLSGRSSYIFVSRPKEVQEEEGSEWQGKLAAIRQQIDKNYNILNQKRKKQTTHLTSVVNVAVSEVKTVEKKVDSIQKAIQDLTFVVKEMKNEKKRL